MKTKFIIFWLFIGFSAAAPAQPNPTRARDLGIPLDGKPGLYNAITDVKGVEVGMTTIIEGSGPLVAGKGPVRTGVTAILPRGKTFDPVFANWYSLNGNGEMTGTTWVTESGFLETPILITNTHSVGVVRDATVAWQAQKNKANKDFDFLMIPNMGHSMGGEYGERKRRDFFVRHLLGVEPPSFPVQLSLNEAK